MSLWKFLVEFAKEHAKELSSIHYEDELSVDLTANQLRALWTAYALQQDGFWPDTKAYDDALKALWDVIEKSGGKPATTTTAQPEKWAELLDELCSPYSKFDLFMGSYLA